MNFLHGVPLATDGLTQHVGRTFAQKRSLSGRSRRVGLDNVVRITTIVLMLWVGVVSVARADFAKDLARIHVEAVGGREQVNALKAFKATGVTKNERGELRFIMWAARPNRLRIEITSGDRTILQAWDGRGAPWIADTQTREVSIMRGERAAELKAEAEFDNPLLTGTDRKVSLDYAGVSEEDGRKLIKLLATQNFTENAFVYLDPVTYLLVRRDVVRRRQGAEVVLRTDLRDFRPVAGVLLPHRLVVSQGGQPVHETIIERIEPNPQLAAGLFALPVPPRE